jgi:hypothetical protein
MDMAMMITGSPGMAGNPTATLLAILVIITTEVGVVQGDAYWTFMPNLPMVHPITWWTHPMYIFTIDTVHMGGHSSGHLMAQYCDYSFTGKAHLMGAWE